MSQLKVIVVPPEYLPKQDRAAGYAVVLGDCVLAGHYLWRGKALIDANAECVRLAEHYGIMGMPITDPESPQGRRAAFRLVVGGLTSSSESRDQNEGGDRE